MDTTTTCGICLDTGWDDLFESECGACGAHLQTADQIDAARAKLDAAREEESAQNAQHRQLIEWLQAQTGNDFAQSLAKQFHAKGVLTEKQMNAARNMYARAHEPIPAGETFYRWVKHEGSWALTGPEGTFGQSVTVRKANGDEQTKTLGIELDVQGERYIYRVGADRVEESTTEQVTEGFWFDESDGEVQIFKVQRSQTGNLYAKQLDGEQGERLSWVYIGAGPVRSGRLQRLDLATAKRFGQVYGACCVCGRTLTNEGSIEAGIGPVCASKL